MIWIIESVMVWIWLIWVSSLGLVLIGVMIGGIVVGISNVGSWNEWLVIFYLFSMEEWDLVSMVYVGGSVEVIGEMLLNGVGVVIIVYSLWYLWNDINVGSFISIISLFVGGMGLIITCNDVIGIWIGWEVIAVTSYLLIEYESNIDSINSGLNGLMLNSIGDFGLMLAMIVGLSDFSDASLFIWNDVEYNGYISFLVALGVLVGAWSNSAQFGLNGWLFDAMVGPTPVSSLLHSATLVLAGIVVIMKFILFFYCNSTVFMLVNALGIITCLFSCFGAIYYMDSNSIIAFSSCFHLGLMFIGCKSNLIMHYMYIHGLSNSMIFMCCGILIHSVYNQDMSSLNSGNAIYGFEIIALLSIIGLTGSDIASIKDHIIEFSLFENVTFGLVWILCFSHGYGIGLLINVWLDLNISVCLFSCWVLILPFFFIVLQLLFYNAIVFGVESNVNLVNVNDIGALLFIWDYLGLITIIALLVCLVEVNIINSYCLYTVVLSMNKSNFSVWMDWNNSLFIHLLFAVLGLFAANNVVFSVISNVEYGLLMNVWFMPLLIDND